MVRPRPGHFRPPGVPLAFTLVELLVVIAIIVLLLAATLPALRGPMAVNARRGAVNNLLGTLDQARALAISEGRATYVVFLNPKPNLIGTTNSATFSPDRAARAYAIFADQDDLALPPQQRSPFLSLPTGIAFKVNATSDRTRTLLNRPLDAIAPKFVVPVATGGTQSVPEPYIKFNATGGTDLQDTSYLRLLLFEGSVDSSNGQELPTKWAAGDHTDLAKQRFVWEEVRLNYATGRARYTVDPMDISVAAAFPAPSPTP